QQQGQSNQGYPSFPPIQSSSGAPSPVGLRQGSPLAQSTQPFVADNRQSLSSPIPHQTSKSYIQDPQQDEFLQRLLASNPNLRLVNQRIDDIPILSIPSSMVSYS